VSKYRADRQTGRQNYDSQDRACIASRGIEEDTSERTLMPPHSDRQPAETDYSFHKFTF